MRILMTLTAAAIATTAVASSAFAEGVIGCDSSLSTDTSISADNCRAWTAPAPQAPAAFAYVPSRTYAAAPKRAHRGRTDVHGGAGD